ncbi:lon-related putative ATP-dependent protease [Lutibacter oceani]|uniref:endopeptidase La n=1 Tax=Lutibacter oceani TaxID=1853311 RepID=A0A3D9RYY6_9FLAO|nr:ATP-binding protein [Lutibacter oceani]REE82346.1 lon-related putative ATP-dependent protease [Lutibacter oceani]
MEKELTPEKLRKVLDSSTLNWSQIREEYQKKPLIGQQRALKALEFGIGNKSGGFNIYVSGYPSSGKLRAVNYFLDEKAKLEKSPGDLCYVNNFKDPYCPKKITLPQGGGEIFKKEISLLIDEVKKALLKAFESKEYADKREKIIDTFKQKEAKLFKNIYQKAKDNNFAIRRTPIEIIVIPIDEKGEPIIDKKFQKLDKNKQEELLKKQKQFKKELFVLLRKNLDLEKESKASLFQLEENVALYAIETLLQDFLNKYKKFNDVIYFLNDVKSDIINNLSEFLDGSGLKGKIALNDNKRFLKYQVNVISDNSDLKGAPIVMELNPTYNNLFGKVERESDMGTYITNFTLIRGGALHKANGGYLIIPLKELLLNYFSYESLKRALKNNEIVIEDISELYGFLSTKSLKPDPIPLNIQIILIGSPRLYYLLYQIDEDFKELFKVKAEFDTSMEYSTQNIKDFAGVIYKIEQENELFPIDEKAIACVIEQASRMVHDQNKLSLKFGEISNILIEAQHYAKLESKDKINLKYINKAIDAKYFRSNLIQEKINEMIKQNQLMIPLSGSKIGQINGLSVLDLGDIIFGKPNKITACIASGEEGLIDIEREAKLAGPIHTKGVLILQGYLLEKYAQNKPISLFASLVFEQSYSEIEGDSASSAELYAILSSLSELPIKQGIAVTGSINQKGEVQPVGAINEKIEGFFEVCKQVGLTGEQGVIIPKSNEQNLMLKQEIVNAVKEKEFHVWSVSNINEGIEILLGHPAGKLLKNKSFSKNSVHYLVDRKIDQLNKNLKKYSNTKQ